MLNAEGLKTIILGLSLPKTSTGHSRKRSVISTNYRDRAALAETVFMAWTVQCLINTHAHGSCCSSFPARQQIQF